MGFTFTVVKADIDERALGDRSSDANVQELVLLLANAKADAIIGRLKPEERGPVLLTADQVVTCNGNILEKPLNVDEFKSFVSEYAVHPCRTVGSVVLTDTATGRRVHGVDTASIYLRPLPTETVEALIAEGEIFYCAGGLMIENPLVQPHINRVEGTLDSVMGLSKELVLRLLQELQSE
jgi:septum formation protein